MLGFGGDFFREVVRHRAVIPQVLLTVRLSPEAEFGVVGVLEILIAGNFGYIEEADVRSPVFLALPAGVVAEHELHVRLTAGKPYLANRHVENPETVVKPGEEVFVKVIDVDLDRRRISLSLKQANDSVDPSSEDFDPALYGMPAEYDEEGNYKYPEGFDPNTNEWIPGYEKQREEWESQYAAAHDLWEQHKEFVAKELENAEASAAEDGQNAANEEKVEETSNYSSETESTGTLADSDQLAALREQLLSEKK